MKLAAFVFGLVSTALAAPAMASTLHEVRMYNRSENGPMIYEPQYLEIAPGDRVKFLATQPSHNAASIDEMLPKGAEPFRGKINEEIEIELTAPGVYGIKCSPHFGMGMVMLIKVGEAELPALPEKLPTRARERFEKIIAAHDLK